MIKITYKDRVTNEEVLHRSNVDRNLMKDMVKRQMEFLGGIGKFVVTGYIEGKRARGLYTKHEGNDAHRTDPPCLLDRCLITVIQIAAYVNMIWHTMTMIRKNH